MFSIQRIAIVLFVMASMLGSFSSCDLMRDIAQDELEDHYQCVPATGAQYNTSYQHINSKTFSSDRMKAANKETILLECMTTEQIRGITKLFDFESDRLEYAKFAFAYCSNPENYYFDLEDLFVFESNKQELENLTR